MQGPADETVGASFCLDRLYRARDLTLEVITQAAAAMKPGSLEADAKTLIARLQLERDSSKSWHPPQIRFGINSVLPFGEKGQEDVRLADEDIFFFDLGPIFDAHEGDVGRSFVIGSDPEKKRCCEDAATIWHEVRDHWKASASTGAALYEFAESRAAARGWQLSVKKANGHRIADFPHAARARGSVEGFGANPAPNRWILEIQIRHPEKPFGAFYEDLLS